MTTPEKRQATERDAARVVQIHHEGSFLEQGDPRRDQICAEVDQLWDEVTPLSLCFQLAKLASFQLLAANIRDSRDAEDVSWLDDYGVEYPELYILNEDDL